MHNNSLSLHCDEEEDISYGERDNFFGEDMLDWHLDEEANDPVVVQPGLNGQFGHQLPDFRGFSEGIHLSEIMDLDPDGSLIPVFSKFFTIDMFENMGLATNSLANYM
jgi:hypothetical protein